MTTRTIARFLLLLACALSLWGPASAQQLGGGILQRIQILEAKVATLESQVAAQATTISGLQSSLNSQSQTITALNGALQTEISDRQAGDRSTATSASAYADSKAASTLASANSYTDASVTPLAQKLIHVSRSGNDLFITGANLYLRNGLNGTISANGLGNLILGYNELRNDGNDRRTGSHNLVLGFGNDFSSAAGFVGGAYNEISAPMATVLTGSGSVASGNYASIAGGYANTAAGAWSTIGGGSGVTAPGQLQHIP